MAIDPDLYEKISGRSSDDAMNRLGSSLADHERVLSRREAANDYSSSTGLSRRLFWKLVVRLLVPVLIAGGLLVGLL